MKNYLFLLAATALLGQVHRVTAQTTASSQGQAMDHLFSTVIRSSAVNPSATTKPGSVPMNSGSGPMNPADLRRCCEKIDRDIQRVYFLRNRSGRMKLQVRGVYTHGAALFFWLQLNNRSPLDYDVDSIAFQITAAGGRQAAPVTPKTLAPFYVFDSTATVPGHSRVTSIFVLPRFTLPAGRQLTIHVSEKNGGRHLQIQAGNYTLERARPV
ncbi:MAG TPA: DUF4138 domain-containing protein [Puia sp.]|nr:DUF4138 domain-containing protein [Puia sp.]